MIKIINVELMVAKYVEKLVLKGVTYNAALRMAKENFKKELSAPTKVTDNSAKKSK